MQLARQCDRHAPRKEIVSTAAAATTAATAAAPIVATATATAATTARVSTAVVAGAAVAGAAVAVAAGAVIIYSPGFASNANVTLGETEGTIVPTEVGQTKAVILSEEGCKNVRMYAFDNKETAKRAFTTNFWSSRILYDVSTPGGGMVEEMTGGIAMPLNTIRAAKDKLGAEVTEFILGFAPGRPS